MSDEVPLDDTRQGNRRSTAKTVPAVPSGPLTSHLSPLPGTERKGSATSSGLRPGHRVHFVDTNPVFVLTGPDSGNDEGVDMADGGNLEHVESYNHNEKWEEFSEAPLDEPLPLRVGEHEPVRMAKDYFSNNGEHQLQGVLGLGLDDDETRRISRLTIGSTESKRRRRRSSPNIMWRKPWWKGDDCDTFADGRVLIVDCYSRLTSEDGRRKTYTNEIENIQELAAFYSKAKRNDKDRPPCLRIVHIQNATWARDFVIDKYGINADDPADDGSFAFHRWLLADKPPHRAGHPVLSTRAFPIHKMSWRHIWRTGFGVDYLKMFPSGHVARYGPANVENFKLLQLNEWSESEDSSERVTGSNSFAARGCDVYASRLTVYVQRNMMSTGLPEEEAASELAEAEAESRTASASSESAREIRDQLMDHVKSSKAREVEKAKERDLAPKFDNVTTIIVFEASHTNKTEDCLISTRDEVERRWRRLFIELPKEVFAPDGMLGIMSMKICFNQLLHGLTQNWEKILTKCDEHLSILEDRIYEDPADETRAPELWANSSVWLKIEKLITMQQSALHHLRLNMQQITINDHQEWFEQGFEAYKRLSAVVDEELVRPTANLSDMMYKSVDIRDSKRSLDLGSSMWRLSWITFVFLPLTFLTGFFGMNVDTFQPGGGYPHVFWYFVAGVPLLTLMFLIYGGLKAWLALRDDPTKRDVYEGINAQFSVENPSLWTKFGPRNDMLPIGHIAQLQHRLIAHWFRPKDINRDPERRAWSANTAGTEMRRDYLTALQEYGSLFRLKHWLATRWLSSMKGEPKSLLGMAENGERPSAGQLSLQATIGSVDEDTMGKTTSAERPQFRLTPSYLRRHQRRSSAESSQSPGSTRPQLVSAVPSEAMVEEEDAADVKRAKEAKEEADKATTVANGKQNGYGVGDVGKGTTIAMGEMSGGSSSGSTQSPAALAANNATDLQIQQVAAAAAMLLQEKGVSPQQPGGYRGRMDSRMTHSSRMRSESKFWGGEGPVPKLQRSRGLLDVPSSSRTAWSSM